MGSTDPPWSGAPREKHEYGGFQPASLQWLAIVEAFFTLPGGYRAGMVELPVVVDAYWRYHALASGGRADRLASADCFWAWEAVNEAMLSDTPLPVLDALLGSPESDVCSLGAGPVEDLLTGNLAAWEEPIAERCRRSDRWRAVLACVWLDKIERERVPHLAEYLKQFG